MNTENTVNDVQMSVVETSQTPEIAESGSEEQTAEVTVRPQSREENAHFRRMRLENERLREENEEYAAAAIQRQMAEDLAAIRQCDPEVTSLEELGDEFATLIAAGVTAPVAFAALRQAQRGSVPPAMGAVNEESRGEKAFYSPTEVDALSPAQLADPGIWAKVRESMTKW
ncbi:MAG: hypothetical protein IJN42_05405 [Clostridia bacterium]|nr:hypothetical protein [Clostridia bacterium]